MMHLSASFEMQLKFIKTGRMQLNSINTEI